MLNPLIVKVLPRYEKLMKVLIDRERKNTLYCYCKQKNGRYTDLNSIFPDDPYRWF